MLGRHAAYVCFLVEGNMQKRAVQQQQKQRRRQRLDGGLLLLLLVLLSCVSALCSVLTISKLSHDVSCRLIETEAHQNF